MAGRKKEFSNILDYIYDYGISSFEEVPFFDMDAAVFAQLAYIELEKCLPINENFLADRLQSVLCQYLSTVRIDNSEYALKGDDAFAMTVMSSPRYKDVIVSRISKIDSATEKIQFYGIQFMLPDGTVVISYRGTDFSITGWEENADLACYSNIRGQKLAATFLQEAFLEFPNSKFEVVGHSKGGNFAVFAASLLSEKDDERLLNVFSFDGPGLLKDMADFIGHRRIQPKIVHIIPDEEIIGLLLSHETPSYVVESAKNGDFIGSHYIMNWKVSGDHFVRAKGISQMSKTISNANEKLFDDYLGNLSVRTEFFAFFFQTIKKLGTQDPRNIFESPVNFFLSFSNAVRKSPNKKIFIGFVRAYISYFGSSLLKGKQQQGKIRR